MAIFSKLRWTAQSSLFILYLFSILTRYLPALA